MNYNGNSKQCSVNSKRTDILRGIVKIRRKRNSSVTKATSRGILSVESHRERVHLEIVLNMPRCYGLFLCVRVCGIS